VSLQNFQGKSGRSHGKRIEIGLLCHHLSRHRRCWPRFRFRRLAAICGLFPRDCGGVFRNRRMPRSMRSAIPSSNICPSALGDVSMINFRVLDHEVRTVALAGTFLQAWATMEMALGGAIGAALGLKTLQQFVLSKNLTFTNKVHIFGALCSVSFLSAADKDSCKVLCKSILDLYPFRNNIAHDAFCSSNSNDGIQFLAFRARGKVSFPDVE
jgi:hypothetical protein